ncbi:MAG: radical SAM protein [Candidatus Sulfobium sp.]|jgi:radical SAM superfamily enzyme YgiQ (UPF0313 family)
MEVKNISFIEVKSPCANIFSKFPMPRLGAVLLSTILKEKGYNVRVFIEDLAEPDWSFIMNSDLVCISTITSTALRAYETGDILKAKGIPVIMGGAHPSFLPDETLAHCDYVVRGEGDMTLFELLSHLEKGKPELSSINGLSYRDKSGAIRHTPQRPLLEDLDSLPDPDFSLVHKWKPSNTYPVATSRGCPFNCNFCSVVNMFGRKCRFRSVEATVGHMKHVASISRATKFFVDDNFAADKARTKEILRGMIAERIKTKWSAQVRTDVARDDELLKLMADSGCVNTFIGFESINSDTLKAYNKKQDLDDIVKCIRKVKDHGIRIHGMFVLGADTDDVDTIRKTADFASRHGINTVQFMVLTPLPGTAFYKEMKTSGRLLHNDWSKYDMLHIVFRPENISPDTLYVEHMKAVGRFYSWKYIFRNLSRFDFFHAAVGLYGKKAAKDLLAEATAQNSPGY